ncbi:MAG: hypothetical protein K2F83_03520 [Oscillospiraceae bacterium]|nr:hypothetical protein [Oscillospiraceae bacterium]
MENISGHISNPLSDWKNPAGRDGGILGTGAFGQIAVWFILVPAIPTGKERQREKTV